MCYRCFLTSSSSCGAISPFWPCLRSSFSSCLSSVASPVALLLRNRIIGAMLSSRVRGCSVVPELAVVQMAYGGC